MHGDLLAITVPADDLRPDGARPSAGTLITIMFGHHYACSVIDRDCKWLGTVRCLALGTDTVIGAD